MPARRATQQSLSVEPPNSSSSSPSSANFPRATSPSGITGLLSKPSKWFRSASGKNIPASVEPRSSTSSVTRKHKISHPTDPRPILSTLRSDPYIGSAGSRSVLDLSSTGRSSTTIDRLPPTPTSPARSMTPSRGLGDLRNISRKAWSRSADDLGKVQSNGELPSLSPLDTNLHEKIHQYRTDRSGSVTSTTPSTSSTPINSPHRTVDFPMITNSSPSTSPPSSGLLSSGSAPGLNYESNIQTHVRSHSFTPRIASRLAPPKLGTAPPTPKRKGSATSDIEIVPGSAVRGAFPHPYSNKSSNPGTPITPKHTLPPSPPQPLMDPPTIIEPSQTDEDHSKNEKRTSQIVYHSSFVNRLGQFSPELLQQCGHQPGVFSKGWKPFKLVLKGSKLYFYKPPNDRMNAIKELFPTELVTTLEDGGAGLGETSQDDEATSPMRGNGKDREDGRRKRAFWGRRTHPDLVLGEGEDGEVERGSLEALVHEAVFGTTFISKDKNTLQHPAQNPRWRAFAVSIVLCLPQLVGQDKFEAEFIRCCNYLISGAEEGEKGEQRVKVMVLADDYLRCHRKPADIDAWESWRKDTIPSFSTLEEFSTGSSAGVPQFSSTRAMFSPSPALGLDFSPVVGTFSPRPDQTSGMFSLIEALEYPSPSSAGSLGSPAMKTSSKQALWNALEHDGLTRDVFLRLDPHLIASSLKVFHRGIWERTPEHFTPEVLFSHEHGDYHEVDHNCSFLTFFGSDARPHWLTKAILLQIFASDGSHASSQFGDDRINLKGGSRAAIMTSWIKIGELCREMGDECSWRAIAAALFSRPIARLEKVWKRVDQQALTVAESWAHPDADGLTVAVAEPKQTPWGGSVRDKAKTKLEDSKIADLPSWNVNPFLEIREMWERVRTSFLLCPRAPDFSQAEESESMVKMLDLWKGMCKEGGSNGSGVASKFTRIDQFMSLSLASEPRRKGLYEPYFWSTPQLPTVHPLVPLQFPEPLPSISLIDRTEVVRGRMESNNLNLQDVQAARNMVLNPENRGKRISLELRSKEASAITGDFGGFDIPVFDGELLVSVQAVIDPSASQPPSRAPSRPPSSVVDISSSEKTFTRAPSIRVRPGNRPGSKGGVERKTSMARRSSLPSIPKRNGDMITSEVPSERPLRVRVKAGTLDKLVDILAHGLQGVSVAFADDNGEMPLREGKHRDLRVDSADFSAVWWSTFRSFVTPLVLFELLRKRYLKTQIKTPSTSVGRLLHVAQQRTELLDAMHEWFHRGSGAEDALDDPRLYDAFKSFLQESPSDHELPKSYTEFQDPHVQEAWTSLEQTRKALTTTFLAQTARPSSKPSPGLDLSADSQSFGPNPPNLDHITPSEFVENVDSMLAAAFQNVTAEDLLITADLLEIQSADRIGWFLPRDPSSVTEEVELQTMHALISEIAPTAMISELGQDLLYRLLPGSIRACVRAFGVLRRWIVSQVVAPKLGLAARTSRIELLLQAIEISRIRNTDTNSSGPPTEQACVRSFVESVVTSALLGSESRLYHRAWQSVAVQRGTSLETLTTLLNPPVAQASRGEPLTVDIGWLMERMIEVINMPDVVDTLTDEAQPMVNFDKRRYLCRLASNVSSFSPAHKGYRRRPVSIRDLKRLNNLEHEASNVMLDVRIIREDALREASTGGTPSKKILRPFNTLVAAQQEKNKRDRYIRDRLSKERRQEQYRHQQREDHFNKAMNPRKTPTGAQKQHRNKKTMSSAFFQFMRPISSAFSSDSLVAAGMKRTPAELDFTPASKPILVLSIAEARIAQFINNERSFTFQLDTEDGGHYLLQALDKKEMMKWINKINHVTKIAAKRRLTYLGNNATPHSADHLLTRPKTGSHNTAVFGIDLQALIIRESQGDPQRGAVPSVIEQCINEVEERGLSEVGIYRIAGATSEINSLKEAFNRGESPITSSTDVYALCDVIKSYLRTLPDPVIPAAMYFEFIAAAKIQDLEPRLDRIRTLIRALPSAHFDLLKRFIEHLDKITDHEEMNQMTSSSIAIVVSPNILRAPRDDFSVTMSNMGHAHGVAKALITHCHVIFNDSDPEADNEEAEIEEDLDLEPAIPEEDEEADEQPLPALSVIVPTDRPLSIFGPLHDLTP